MPDYTLSYPRKDSSDHNHFCENIRRNRMEWISCRLEFSFQFSFSGMKFLLFGFICFVCWKSQQMYTLTVPILPRKPLKYPRRSNGEGRYELSIVPHCLSLSNFSSYPHGSFPLDSTSLRNSRPLSCTAVRSTYGNSPLLGRVMFWQRNRKAMYHNAEDPCFPRAQHHNWKLLSRTTKTI